MEIKKILILLIFAIAIAGIIAPASAAIDSADNNKVYSVESKEKSVTNKIIWNANGGKIGSKSTIVTTVKKGSKIGKLPDTPKRSGYTFSGWYTKKTGGSKITANTKPTKAVSYFAQWKKSTPTKSGSNSKFVGKWVGKDTEGIIGTFIFKNDGTFTENIDYSSVDDGYEQIQGKWKTYVNFGDTISFTSNKYREKDTNGPWSDWESAGDTARIYRFLKDSKGEYFQVIKAFDSYANALKYYKVK